MARAKRSFDGKNDSRSNTPIRVTGGDWIAWMKPARSRSCFCLQAVSRMVERRMCSLLWMGSASIPSRLSRLVTVVLMRSLNRSLSSMMTCSGAAKDLRMDTGNPALLPGV